MISKGEVMAKSEAKRKLTAILCTDVVGYSRLKSERKEIVIGKT